MDQEVFIISMNLNLAMLLFASSGISNLQITLKKGVFAHQLLVHLSLKIMTKTQISYISMHSLFLYPLV